MSIKSIRIKNLLSFDELIIHDIQDINCIVGQNNSGKSNLLKLLKFFYNKLDNKRELPPTLNSNYSTFGTITIIYDTSRINKIVTSETNKNKSNFFKYIYNTLFKENLKDMSFFELNSVNKNTIFELTLQINSNDSTQWSTSNKDILNIINYLYPFFEVETRHIDLYDWNKLWLIVSKLKSFNITGIKQGDIIDFFDENISKDSHGYKEYISKIQDIVKTGKYNYREKVLNYVKAGLNGQTFLIDDKSLETQSDGTNSYRFIEIALELLISLSRREYINPTIYIDEPEVGLHPKRNEELINKLYDVYNSFQKTISEKEQGKYKTPYPQIIFATHSPNIVKEVIKLFDEKQQILHFSKKNNGNTIVKKMKSTYKDKRFLNIFSDNEARLFFSNFIFFVEGETEVEIFSNKRLSEKFLELKKIDVYKSSSNVLSGDINPSASNTSVPYLFLFDIDKFYTVENQSNLKKIKLKNSNSNLYILPTSTQDKDVKKKIAEELQKYNKGYNKKYNSIGQSYKELQKFSNNTSSYNLFKFNVFTHRLEKEKLNHFQESLTNYLKTKQILYVKTTVEEVLINYNSKELFYKWLEHEYQVDINYFLYKKRVINITRTFYKRRTHKIGKIEILNPRIKIKKEIIYLKRRKGKYINELLIDYIRVHYFNGKFEDLENSISISDSKEAEKIIKIRTILKLLTQFSIPVKLTTKKINEFIKVFNINDRDKFISFICNIFLPIKLTEKQEKKLSDIFELQQETFRDRIFKTFIKKIETLKIPSKLDKTSGWATSFLNFAIDNIEEQINGSDVTKREEEFRKVFKQNFGELYDIITAIENKLQPDR
jgi:AAA15 family ATPase/GTPase